jgi:hypothetical protein
MFAALIAALALAVVPTVPARAFGTLNSLGQNAEHEHITRLALTCAKPDASGCFEPKSLAALAGERGRTGAIGMADVTRLALSSRAHCDNADFLDQPGYPQSAAAARAKLVDCRDWMRRQLELAVEDAAVLANGGGRDVPVENMDDCFRETHPGGGAKCKVIADLGLLMHASQDFYAHTNWVDRADPDRPLSTDNPPGLGHDTPAPFISLREIGEPPAGLISGCFVAPPEFLHCRGRVRHAVLNKDEGEIEPVIASPSTPRGRFGGNFARAVRAAIADTADKWALFQQRLSERYGAVRAARMVCVIVSDAPRRSCGA